MGKKQHTSLLLFFIYLTGMSQVSTTLLQNFANPALFNLNDTQCPNLSGEWQGEETEYYDSLKNEKGKYAVSFILKQQGNQVSGVSTISFDNGTSYGKLKIRGLVAGNKLYFEEYEVVEQKFIKPGVLWCLRTGELDIQLTGNKAVLSGSNYKGYASFYYFPCQGLVSMRLNKTISDQEARNFENNNPGKEKYQMRLHPNPANTEVVITFDISSDIQVRIDLYSLSGEWIDNITNEFYKAGNHQKPFSLHPYAAGAYLVRMQTISQNISRTLVIAR